MSTLRRSAVTLAGVLAAATGLSERRRRRRHRQGDFRLYVLEYHDVSAGPDEREGVVSRRRFRRHLLYLRQRYRLVTVTAAVERLAAPLTEPLRDDLLAVTFDDGYLGNYEAAWPELRELGLPATLYLTTGFLDGAPLWFDVVRRTLAPARRQGSRLDPASRATLARLLGSWPVADAGNTLQRLKDAPGEERQAAVAAIAALPLERAPAARPIPWEAVREMQTGGIEMGAHTVTHPILSRLPRGEQEHEIRAGGRRLAEATGTPPTSFAYPNGSAADYTAETVDLVRAAGFRAACTTRKGANRPGGDPFTLRRLGIGSDSLAVVAARLAGFFDEGSAAAALVGRLSGRRHGRSPA